MLSEVDHPLKLYLFLDDFRNVMQNSLNKALPHRGITKKIIAVGTDSADDSKFVIFSFDPLTRTEITLGQITAQRNSAIIQVQGMFSITNSG